MEQVSLFLPLGRIKTLGNLNRTNIRDSERCFFLKKEGRPVRGLGTQGGECPGKDVSPVYSRLGAEDIGNLQMPKSRQINKKQKTNKKKHKAFSLQPKDQEKGSLARQKMFRQYLLYFRKMQEEALQSDPWKTSKLCMGGARPPLLPLTSLWWAAPAALLAVRGGT